MIAPTSFIVVDDNRTNNLICEFAIRKSKSDAQVKLFTDPEVALEYIKSRHVPDEGGTATILFLDINMPSMTGWNFLDELKKLGQEVFGKFAIFILTSSVDERDKEKALSNPLVTGFLSKPLTVRHVQEAVDALRKTRSLNGY